MLVTVPHYLKQGRLHAKSIGNQPGLNGTVRVVRVVLFRTVNTYRVFLVTVRTPGQGAAYCGTIYTFAHASVYSLHVMLALGTAQLATRVTGSGRTKPAARELVL